MNHISANELKTRGISCVEKALVNTDEAIITVRGKEKYVVINIAEYSKLREHELEIALLEAKADLAGGQHIRETVAEHIQRISKKA